jgi:hypothetical protein
LAEGVGLQPANHFPDFPWLLLGASFDNNDGKTATASSNGFIPVCVYRAFMPNDEWPVSLIRISCDTIISLTGRPTELSETAQAISNLPAARCCWPTGRTKYCPYFRDSPVLFGWWSFFHLAKSY